MFEVIPAFTNSSKVLKVLRSISPLSLSDLRTAQRNSDLENGHIKNSNEFKPHEKDWTQQS